MTTARIIARYLLEIEAVKLQPNDPFTWASGMRSPIYCDNRITLSYPAVRGTIKSAFADLAKKYEGITMIAGVATAGIAHGALLADALGLPYIYVRSSAKKHGRQNLIEGRLFENARVLVVEDLISTGGSSLQAVDALRSKGAEVAAVVAVFNYGFTIAEENFAKHQCNFATLSDYPTLLEEAIKMKYITSEAHQVLQKWNSNPANWYEENFN